MLQTTLLLATLMVSQGKPSQTSIHVVDSKGNVVGAGVEVHAKYGAFVGARIACGSTDGVGLFKTDELGPGKRPDLREVRIHVSLKGSPQTYSFDWSWAGEANYPTGLKLPLSDKALVREGSSARYVVARCVPPPCCDPCRCSYIELPAACCATLTVDPCSPCAPCGPFGDSCAIVPSSTGPTIAKSSAQSTSRSRPNHVAAELQAKTLRSAQDVVRTSAPQSESGLCEMDQSATRRYAEASWRESPSPSGWRASKP